MGMSEPREGYSEWQCELAVCRAGVWVQDSLALAERVLFTGIDTVRVYRHGGS